jgi:hypothetical protein
MTEELNTSSAQRHEKVQPEQKLTNQSSSIYGLERPATVFLSYAREDTKDVRDLQLRLNVRGIRSWRDVDDLPSGSLIEGEIVQAIEREVDAIALYITPDCLKSHFIWKIEVPAALRRHERDPHFHIVPILQGVSFSEIRQFCLNWNLADLSRFNGISLTDDGSHTTWEAQNEKRNDAAKRILQAALALRLRRINADRSYEPWICLKTFFFEPPTANLDLDLNWLKLVHEKERLPTLQEWEQILLPALLDVKQITSEKVSSRRIHVFVQRILPVAIALGFAFRESSRFTLLLEGQRETWSTDTQPLEKEPLRSELNFNDHGDLQAAVVEVATTRSIKQSVEDTLPLLGLAPGYHIRLELPELSREAVRDADHAQAIAQQVGRVSQHLCDQQRVARIHLFVLLPAELAVLIGHQLNALCPLTLYEFGKERVYKPVGTIL